MFRSALRTLLNLDESPERTALAFAVGAFLAFSPLLGLQTILAALIAIACRLNKVAVITGTLLSNPWTIGFIVAGAWAIGSAIIGSPPVELPQAGLGVLFTAEFWQSLAAQWRQLLPFALGSVILSTASAAVSYPLMLHFLRAYRRKYGRPGLASSPKDS